MLAYILYGLFLLACFVLVVAVLLQPGKADAGALFTSSISSTAFGPRGTQTLLAKITIGAAAIFMLVALTLALPGVTGPRSVLEGAQAPAAATPTPTPVPEASPAVSASPGTDSGAGSGQNSNAPRP